MISKAPKKFKRTNRTTTRTKAVMLNRGDNRARVPSAKQHKPAQHLTVLADQAGQRIDNFLLRELKHIPKSAVYKMLRKGEVRINSKRIKPIYKVQEGDVIRIPPLVSGNDGQVNAKIQIAGKTKTWLEKRIIYEDDALLVLNKPSGIAAHGGSGIKYGVIEALRVLRPNLHRLELVHRLDRDTSGCMMLAKKHSMLRNLHMLLREGGIAKTYVALVKGKWHGKERIIEEPLAKKHMSSGERFVKVSKEGKRAITVFRPLQIFSNASLLEVELHTGKTHQIRVHAAHLGFPLAGDEKYGERDFNKTMRALGLRRMFLHAKSVAFQYQDTGERVHFSAPLDEELNILLDKLQNKNEH